MSTSSKSVSARREFLKATGRVAACSALAGVGLPPVHAAGSGLIQVALIGCGGRGTGAAKDALSTTSGPIKLVAMADVFERRLSVSYEQLKKQFGSQVDVPGERKFVGFDGFKNAMDCLKRGDVAIFATPPGFRWAHFGTAIEKGLHVFMEKPITVDGPTTRRFLQLADQSKKKNLKVGVGLMIRHCRGRQELERRIRGGEIGEIVAMRAYRMAGTMVGFARRKPEGISEVLFQVQQFHSFLWASGGTFSDFYIHQIDECSWMKGDWPVKAQAVGGRHYRGESIDQNFDNYSVEFTYPDGTKLFYFARRTRPCTSSGTSRKASSNEASASGHCRSF